MPLAWPREIDSVSHVTLPIPPEDPIYGMDLPHDAHGFTLGAVNVRGELALLQVPLAQSMRLRYNPFLPYLDQQVLQRHVSGEGA